MKNAILILSLFFFAFSAQAQINYNNNSISGDYSGALGSDNTVSGNNSLAAGYISNISGNYSFSLGYNNTITDDGAIALGTITTAESIGAISIGNKLKTTGSYAVTIGKGHHNGYLVNNISSSLMIGFQSDIPTFFVGSASGPGTVGKVGIGTTEPAALLDVNGDINLSGNILKNGNPMQFSPWNMQSADLYYTGGKVGVGTSAPEAKLHIANGDVFIEDINSGIIMKSPNGQCWRGQVDNFGQLSFTVINCDNLTTQKNISSENEISVSPNPSNGTISVRLSNHKAIELITVSNSTGTIIKKELEPKSEYVSYDLTNYSAGIYVLTVLYKDNSVSSNTFVITK